MTNMIADADEQITALLDIAAAQRKAGDHEGATDTANLTLAIAERKRRLIRQEYTIWRLGAAMAEAGRFGKALAAAEHIGVADSRAELLEEIAAAQVRMGDCDGARRSLLQAVHAANLIDDNHYRKDRLSSIAKGQILAGFSDDAVRTADQIVFDRNVELPKIAQVCVEARDTSALKQLLIPCAYSTDATYRLIGLLSQVYPKQVASLHAMIFAKQIESIRGDTTREVNETVDRLDQQANSLVAQGAIRGRVDSL